MAEAKKGKKPLGRSSSSVELTSPRSSEADAPPSLSSSSGGQEAREVQTVDDMLKMAEKDPMKLVEMLRAMYPRENRTYIPVSPSPSSSSSALPVSSVSSEPSVAVSVKDKDKDKDEEGRRVRINTEPMPRSSLSSSSSSLSASSSSSSSSSTSGGGAGAMGKGKRKVADDSVCQVVGIGGKGDRLTSPTASPPRQLTEEESEVVADWTNRLSSCMLRPQSLSQTSSPEGPNYSLLIPQMIPLHTFIHALPLPDQPFLLPVQTKALREMMGSVEALLVFAQSALETASSIAESQRPSVLPDPDRQWLKDKLRSVSCFFSPPDPVIVVKHVGPGETGSSSSSGKTVGVGSGSGSGSGGPPAPPMAPSAPMPPPPPPTNIPTGKKMTKATSTNGLASLLAGAGGLRKTEPGKKGERDISADLSLELVGAITGGLKLRKVTPLPDKDPEPSSSPAPLDFASRLRKTPVAPQMDRDKDDKDKDKDEAEGAELSAGFGVKLKRRSVALDQLDARLAARDDQDKAAAPAPASAPDQPMPEWMKRRKHRSMDPAAFSKLFKEEGHNFQ